MLGGAFMGMYDEVKEFFQSEIDRLTAENCTNCEHTQYFYSSDTPCRKCEAGKKILDFKIGIDKIDFPSMFI